jgi:hypothetical protein
MAWKRESCRHSDEWAELKLALVMSRLQEKDKQALLQSTGDLSTAKALTKELEGNMSFGSQHLRNMISCMKRGVDEWGMTLFDFNDYMNSRFIHSTPTLGKLYSLGLEGEFQHLLRNCRHSVNVSEYQHWLKKYKADMNQIDKA